MSRIRIIRRMMNTHRNMISETFLKWKAPGTGASTLQEKPEYPFSLDREEYMELDTEPEPEPMPEDCKEIYGRGILSGILKESGFPRKLQNICTKSLLLPSIRKQEKCW